MSLGLPRPPPGKREAPAGFSQTASHLGPLWLLKILCVGHGAVSSQEANKESRDKVWASVKNLSFVFWGVLTLLWACLVAQLVKNRLHCGRTGFDQSLGWEDPMEEGMATHSSILTWRIPTDRGAWWAAVHGAAKSRTQLND